MVLGISSYYHDSSCAIIINGKISYAAQEERFTREKITRATIVLHPDNRSIFQEIIAGRADVMMTDGIEVRLQTGRYPELAGTMAEPFTRAGKAILLSPGSELTARVDAWLMQPVNRDQIAERLERALDGGK